MTDNSEPSEFERKQIINALEHVLSTDKFVAAPQMSAFLRYVVEQSVSGNKNRIKAYTVAIDALGKPDTFDPQNDPVVRVLAGRLRSSLDGYYETHSSTNVIIQMKPGSYVPIFLNQQKSGISDNSPIDSSQTTLASNSANSTGKNNTVPTADVSAQNDTALLSGQAEHLSSDTNNLSLSQEQIEKTSAAIAQNEQIRAAGLLERLVAGFRQGPKAAIAIAVLTLMLITTYLNRSAPDSEPNMRAASPLISSSDSQISNRMRPGHLSIFVSAIDHGNVLKNQLNGMMSGVFSESDQVRVYRILESNAHYRFWPEDYVLSLDVLSLPTETRIGIQLMAAQTGRISHSDNLILSATAMQRLTLEELEQITDFSRNLVSEQGPLVSDYQATIEASNSAEQ